MHLAVAIATRRAGRAGVALPETVVSLGRVLPIEMIPCKTVLYVTPLTESVCP